METMQGNLSQISLNDLLLLATSAKKSGVLKLTRGKETVDVYLTGNIVHAIPSAKARKLAIP
jgi:hypothetical protein